jgi:hypothetical protein
MSRPSTSFSLIAVKQDVDAGLKAGHDGGVMAGLSPLVMAGLVPAIHVFLAYCSEARRGCPAQGRA